MRTGSAAITDSAVTIAARAHLRNGRPVVMAMGSNYGLSGSATQVERIFPPEKNTQKQTVTGDSTTQTDAIYQLLRSKKMV